MIKAGVLIDERYEIQGVLGTGSFGYVYKAWHKLLDRSVAVKVMNSVVMEESDGMARFEREARAMSALHHKNIVGFHGFGVWEGAPYMVMEYLQGTSLQTLLASKQPLHQVRALEVMIQLCDALESAHRAGIVHRDLKPSNLMLVDFEGRETLKIIDFGLAKMMPGYGIAAQRLTETGYAVGTCHYMSPEQCVGNAEVDHRTDIYAAGCLLYETLVGVPPFLADDSVAVMYQHVNAPPPRISAALHPDAQTHALQAVIDKAMAKEVDDRYQSAEEMLKDLRAVAIGNTRAHALAEVAKTARPKGTPLYQKRDLKKLLPIVLILAVISAAGILIFSMQHKRAETADVPVLASTVYDELMRSVYRNGRTGTRQEREHLVALMRKVVALNKQDHTLSAKQLYMVMHEQEWNLYILGRIDEGIALCLAALEAAPPDADKFSDIDNLERGYEMKGQNSKAEQLLREVTTKYTLSTGQEKKLNIALSRLALKRGDAAESRRLLAKVPEFNLPNSSIGNYYALVGDLAFLDGQYLEARKAYENGLNSTGAGDEALFQGDLARCDLALKRTSDYARARNALDALSQRFDGSLYLNLALLNAVLSWELHDTAVLKKIAEDMLRRNGDISELKAINEWDQTQFERVMKAAGYNQLLERIQQKYGWS